MTIDLPKKQSFFPARRQRIERWMAKDRSEIIVHDQNQTSFSSISQVKHRFNQELYQLGEMRQRLIEQNNFNQKLFANKQAMKHKDNTSILSTLNYVRKCCQQAKVNIEEVEVPIDNSTKPIIRPTPSLRTDRTSSKKLVPRSSMNESIRDIFLKHNHISSVVRSDVKSQSASQSHRSRTKSLRPVTSADERQISDPITCPSLESISSTNRVITPSSSIQDFRLHPERYLSPNNRYLPLLRRQATDINKPTRKVSRTKTTITPTYVDFITEGAKSFLSDDLDGSIFTSTKLRAPTKINLLERSSIDDDHGRRSALNSLRNCEYENLQRLIQSNSIGKIIEPMVEKDTQTSSSSNVDQLDQILRSIDSLGCPADRKRRQRSRVTNIDKTHSNLAILIF